MLSILSALLLCGCVQSESDKLEGVWVSLERALEIERRDDGTLSFVFFTKEAGYNFVRAQEGTLEVANNELTYLVRRDYFDPCNTEVDYVAPYSFTGEDAALIQGRAYERQESLPAGGQNFGDVIRKAYAFENEQGFGFEFIEGPDNFVVSRPAVYGGGIVSVLGNDLENPFFGIVYAQQLIGRSTGEGLSGERPRLEDWGVYKL